MESSGTVPRVGITAGDLPEWDRIHGAAGPFVSLYLDTRVQDAETPREIDLRWRAARTELAPHAPEPALDALEQELALAHTLGNAFLGVADQSGLLLARHLDMSVGPDRLQFGSFPMLTPLIDWLQAREPYVAVVVDHAGADIAVFDRDFGPTFTTVGEEDHSDPELHNPQPGGWSQARYQRRAKGRWRANAGEAADRVTMIVDELRPRFVALAGDVRSVQLFRDQVPPRVRDLVRDVSGTRAKDGSGEQHEADIERVMRTVVAEDTVALAHKFAEELGQHDRGVTGAEETFTALAQARVATLLVHDDPTDERTAWSARDVQMVALEKEDLESVGARQAREGRLIDVAVWAALSTGAAVRVTPSIATLREGIGAVLRH